MSAAPALQAAAAAALAPTQPQPHPQPQPQHNEVRVAVVGSGLTGLAAAYFLSNDLLPLHTANSTTTSTTSPSSPPAVHVDLFERAPRLGMDAASISVTDPASQRSARLDTPLRAVNRGYYPELLTLYNRLQIPLRPSNFTFSFATISASAAAAAQTNASTSSHHEEEHKHQSTTPPLPRAPAPSFIYLGSSGHRGARMPSSFRTRIPSFTMLDARHAWAGLSALAAYGRLLLLYSLGYLHFLCLCLYHSWRGHTRDPNHRLASVSLAEWARSAHISRRFLVDILVPILSATQTARDSLILHQPCAEVLEFTALAYGESTYRVATGVHSVVQALTAHMPPGSLHLSSNIVEMAPSKSKPGAVLLKVVQAGTASQAGTAAQAQAQAHEFDGYDYVIFALQANHTARILRDYEARLRLHHHAASSPSSDAEHLRTVIENLEQFPYERNVVINHTDARMLPADEHDRCDLNLVSPAPRAAGRDGLPPLPLPLPLRKRRFAWRASPAGDALAAVEAAQGSSEDESDDRDATTAVDTYLRADAPAANHGGHGHAPRAAAAVVVVAARTAAPEKHDASALGSSYSLVAPEGCTMTTHLVQHYTTRRPRPSSQPSADASEGFGDGALARDEGGAAAGGGGGGSAGPQPTVSHRPSAARSSSSSVTAASNDDGREDGPTAAAAAAATGAAAAGDGGGGGDGGVLFLQTTNPIAPYVPRKELTLSISHFERVVPSLRAKQAQARFFTWARVDGGGGGDGHEGGDQQAWRRRTAAAAVGSSSSSSSSSAAAAAGAGAGANPQVTPKRRTGAFSVRAPREGWKVRLGDLQQLRAADADAGVGVGARGGASRVLVAGSWGPPAIPLLEGCVTSARLVVSELLAREGLYSPICDELGANAM